MPSTGKSDRISSFLDDLLMILSINGILYDAASFSLLFAKYVTARIANAFPIPSHKPVRLQITSGRYRTKHGQAIPTNFIKELHPGGQEEFLNEFRRDFLTMFCPITSLCYLQSNPAIYPNLDSLRWNSPFSHSPNEE